MQLQSEYALQAEAVRSDGRTAAALTCAIQTYAYAVATPTRPQAAKCSQALRMGGR